jgi:hypothetical protein
MESTNYGRVLNAARRAQGFVSQAHLDAFYRAYDHRRACAVCSRIAGVAPVFDGMQPYTEICAEGLALERASWIRR